MKDLQEGDLIRTADHGHQSLKWVGSRTVAAFGDMVPVLFPAGSIGNDRDLRVSPQHRMLLFGWRAEMVLGMDEALVPARHMQMARMGCACHASARVAYFHLLFDCPEIIFPKGCRQKAPIPIG
ncbi:Hint domain-containing protein [Shimia sp. SDUM112013]|uniref:Hint domain-containing protein n=1 Tax=Shimia sp. SDUM112013 TaxID=3136160 RepID=UPI0032EFE6AC